MRKWIILILMVLTVTTVNAGFFPVLGGNSSTKGLLMGLNGFFISQGCFPSWTLNYGSCGVNDTQIKYYTDLNSCGSITGIPGDNSTYVSCNYCSYDLKYTELTYCHGKTNETQNVTVFDSNWVSCCNVTGLSSDCYGNDTIGSNTTYYETIPCGDLRMEQVAIAIILVGLIGFLLYIGKNINERTVEGQLITLNSYLKMFVYGLAGLVSFVSFVIAVGMADAGGLAGQVTQPLLSLYQFVLWGFILIFGLFLLSITVNTLYSVYIYALTLITKRRPRR